MKDFKNRVISDILVTTISAIFIKFFFWEISIELFPKLVKEGYIPEDPNFFALLMTIIIVRIIIIKD
jgi:hypothetical protein